MIRFINYKLVFGTILVKMGLENDLGKPMQFFLSFPYVHSDIVLIVPYV